MHGPFHTHIYQQHPPGSPLVDPFGSRECFRSVAFSSAHGPFLHTLAAQRTGRALHGTGVLTAEVDSSCRVGSLPRGGSTALGARSDGLYGEHAWTRCSPLARQLYGCWFDAFDNDRRARSLLACARACAPIAYYVHRTCTR